MLLGCAMPTIEIGQGAIIGAGDTQRGFDYDRSIRFAAYSEPPALLFVLGGIALVVLAVFGLVRGSGAVLILAAAVLSFAFVVEVVRIGDQLRWTSGVYSCQELRLEECAPFVAPAVRDLQADILERPEAGDPEFELLAREGYRARGKLGWSLIAWASAIIALVTAFRAFRLVLRPLWAGVAVTLSAFVFLVVALLWSLQGLE